MIVCDELNIGDAIDALDNIDSLKTIIVIGKPEVAEVKSCIALGDLLEDDGNATPPKLRLDTDWEKQTVYLPFTSTSSGGKGIEHTHKSLVSSFFSPDGAANHWFDQMTGDSIVCGNWFFHMSGLYSFALAAIYGITLYTQSDYSDNGLLEAVVENKVNTVTMYSWQVIIDSKSNFSRFPTSLLG